MLKDIVLKDAELTGGEEDIVATVQEPKSEAELEAELAEPTTDVSAVEEVKPEREEKADEEAEEAVAAEVQTPEKK